MELQNAPVSDGEGKLRDEASREYKMAEMILVVIGDGPYSRDSLQLVVLDEIFGNGEEYDDYAPFDPVFDSLITQGLIVEMPDGFYHRADWKRLAEWIAVRIAFDPA